MNLTYNQRFILTAVIIFVIYLIYISVTAETITTGEAIHGAQQQEKARDIDDQIWSQLGR